MGPLALKVDDFHYASVDEVEDISRYRPGGYHPVQIGDMLSTFATPHNDPRLLPRYRILHKLGWGSNATVWLARDLCSARFVALKILTAEATEGSREARILRSLSPQNGNEGGRYVVCLLDDFHVEGPNGKHQVLVTEVLASLSSVVRQANSPKLVKQICRQAILGLAFLHSRGIAHGDLHLGNLGCTIPRLDDFSEDDLLELFDAPSCTVVLPRSAQDQSDSLPPYLVTGIPMAKFVAVNANFDYMACRLQIFDFGSAYCQGESRPAAQVPTAVRAPEIVFPAVALGNPDPDWDIRSDVWSVSCTIYEVCTRSVFFYGVGLGRGLLKRMVDLVGRLPPLWAPYRASQEYLQKQDVSMTKADAEWMDRRPYLKLGCSDENDLERLLDFLRAMLVLNPSERLSVNQIAKHPWLIEVAEVVDTHSDAFRR